jgi:hypothetical protein
LLPILTKVNLVACETAANAGTATTNNLKLFLKTGRHRVHFRNCANTPARVWIYDCVTKRDGFAAGSTPVFMWRGGLADMGAGTYPEMQIGVTPYRSPEFNRLFAVNKVTQFNLEAGQEHQHTVRHRWNKLVNTVNFQNSVSPYCQGLTRFMMIVFHGTLIHGTDNVVSYAPIKVDYTSTTEFSYGWIEKNSPSMSITNNFASSLVGATFMGENGDADIMNINA